MAEVFVGACWCTCMAFGEQPMGGTVNAPRRLERWVSCEASPRRACSGIPGGDDLQRPCG